MVVIRDVAPEDRAAFLVMWDDFVAYDPDEPMFTGMGAVNWERLMDPANPFKGLVAVDESGARLGFTLYLAFPFSFSRGDACYLQDLYVVRAARGRGIARSMITELAERGRKAGWFKIFWMTQPDNDMARRLYDSVAQVADFVRYDLHICKP